MERNAKSMAEKSKKKLVENEERNTKTRGARGVNSNLRAGTF